MSETTRLLIDEIYPQLDKAEAVKDLDPQDRQAYFVLECPDCETREAYLYKNAVYIKCSRLNECGFSQSLWDYIQTRNGFNNQETLKELARLANYTLPDLSGHSYEKAEKAREKANIFETAMSFFETQLWTEQGQGALGYLKDRGYTEGEIKAMGLGFYPSQAETKASLSEKGINTIKNTGLDSKGFGDAYKVVIPYRDPAGQLKGFIVRATDKETEPKYKFSYGLEKDSLVNLHNARGQKSLVIVEGFFDAFISTQRGIKGVVATGGAHLTEANIENAVRSGVKSFILALDNDKAGQDGTDKAIDRISQRGLKAFVVSLPETIKDPDQLIKEQGAKAFKESIKNAQSGAKWKAQRILSKHDLDTDIGNQEALDEALAYESTLIDPIDSKQFKEAIRTGLDISDSILDELTQDHREKRAKKLLKDDYQDLLSKGQRLLKENKIGELREHIEGRTRDLKAKAGARMITPYTWQDLEQDTINTPTGLRTGYNGLDRHIRIPQGAMTIIAGRPSHGKTTFLLNLFLKMIWEYQDKAFFYFSYEEAPKRLGYRVLNMLSGEVIDESRNLTKIEAYIRGKNIDRQKIEEGKVKFKDLTESGRLWLRYEHYLIDDLVDTLTYLAGEYNIGAVFIDYIQKIKTKGGFGTRQLELQRVSERILETSVDLSLPILLGAQLGRPSKQTAYTMKNIVRIDNIREAGDIEQDANLILGLWNEHKAEGERYEDDKGRDSLTIDPTDLKVVVMKNRDGTPGDIEDLKFYAPTLTITDKEEPDSPFLK